MLPAEPVVPPPTVAQSLRDLDSSLGGLGRGPLRDALAPVLASLASGPSCEPAEAVEAAFALSRSLYGRARSGEALPLARAALSCASAAGDAVLTRRAAIVCGLLSADSADLVGAVEHYVAALRLAADARDAVAQSMVWNNIGMAMGIAAHYELASRCYRRALALLEDEPQPHYIRYAAWANLADSLFQVGEHEQGLPFARMALEELTPAFRDQDLHNAVLLHRNLVRLYTALGHIPEAQAHVAECIALAQKTRSPRSAIAAATAQATCEMAQGRTDFALTRLEGALARAREVPAALRDTLACIIRAEEAAGNVERALLRLDELSDHIYNYAIERAHEHVELAALPRTRPSVAQERGQAEARLVSKVAPPAPPEAWNTLDRLAVSAVMRMDPTGRHGKRVGVLVKALALSMGGNPLHALEMGLAAELHDIGMMSVPQGILGKRGPLNAAERAIVGRHVEAGVEMLRDDRHTRIFTAREIAQYHHARWDGAGHPANIGGNRIPFAARACAIADAYDAMVCGLCGGAGRSMDEALGVLRREAGAQFDPELVERFDDLIRTETQDLGMDLASNPSVEDFQELVSSLTENRGFV